MFMRRRHATASVLVTHGLAAQPRVFEKGKSGRCWYLFLFHNEAELKPFLWLGCKTTNTKTGLLAAAG